jgi:hypothetical protein
MQSTDQKTEERTIEELREERDRLREAEEKLLAEQTELEARRAEHEQNKPSADRFEQELIKHKVWRW